MGFVLIVVCFLLFLADSGLVIMYSLMLELLTVLPFWQHNSAEEQSIFLT